MKKLANLVLMLALFSLPIACGGGADMDFPPVNENPNPSDNPPNVSPVETPDVNVDETPEPCPADDPDCHHHDWPEIGPVEKPEYGKVSDHLQPQLNTRPPIQIDPCLVNPDGEGC